MKAALLVLVATPAFATPVAMSTRPAKTTLRGTKRPAGFSYDGQGAKAPANGCMVGAASDKWLAGDTQLDFEFRQRSIPGSSYAHLYGIEQLVTGTDPHLERTLLYHESGNTYDESDTLVGRARVALAPIAESKGIVVYGYRYHAESADNVFLVVPTTGASELRFQTFSPESGRSDRRNNDCAFATLQLQVVNGASQSGRIVGQSGKQYFWIDASVSKTSRDPEPLVDVTLRVY